MYNKVLYASTGNDVSFYGQEVDDLSTVSLSNVLENVIPLTKIVPVTIQLQNCRSMLALDDRAEPKICDQKFTETHFQEFVIRMSEKSEVARDDFTAYGSVNTKYNRVLDDLSVNVPASYTSNSLKENLCLEYVNGFKSQFEQTFLERKLLYMCPPNEKAVKKFVCTTLRPTLLPYKDLYDYNNLAQFVSNLIQYEPLADICEPPYCLPSPTFVIRHQKGDSFDMAMLLASLLIGAGYDAYVVNGIAPKYICLKETMGCPFENQWDSLYHESSKWAKDVIDSSFACKEADGKDPFEQSNPGLTKDLSKNEEDGDDSLHKKRVHAWVLIKAGKRNVSEHIYIEPTTGNIYPIDNAPYYTIETLWNNENYWVNMQVGPISTLMVDFCNCTHWEYVYLSTSKIREPDVASLMSTADSKEILDEKNAESEVEAAKLEGEADDPNRYSDEDLILDVPSSWVQQLHIDRTVYRTKYIPDGQSVSYYKNGKIESFGDSCHDQGIVKRITRYEDVMRSLPVKIIESLSSRRDKLEFRVRLPLENQFEEYFAPVRGDALRARLEWIGSKRVLYFYVNSRLDGLVRRVIVFKKSWSEYYQDRDDFLISRSVKLRKKNESDWINTIATSSEEVIMTKMVETYARNNRLRADKDIRKLVFDLHHDRIVAHYHYEEGRITAKSKTFTKKSVRPLDVSLTESANARSSLSSFEEELALNIAKEKECDSAVRHSGVEMQDLLRLRKGEEANVILETSVFDAERVAANAKEDGALEKAEKSIQQIDYLMPFLQSIHRNDRELTKEDGQKVREMCLRNLKERLLERASIIQSRLDKENTLLAKRQAAFQRIQRENGQAADDEHDRICSESMFRIQILEQRLAMHEETALQKYAEMDRRLYNDPRLSALQR